MPGRAKAKQAGDALEQRVARVAEKLGLEVRPKYLCGRRLWGAKREIDLVLRDDQRQKTLGIECKSQDKRGSAEEKIPALIADIEAWPIPGLVVFDGKGYSDNMRSYLVSSGRAVELKDLEPWLRLFFGLPLED